MNNVLSIFTVILKLKVKVFTTFAFYSFDLSYSELNKEGLCNSSGNVPLIVVFPSLVKMMSRHFHWKEKESMIWKTIQPLFFLNQTNK